MPDPLTVRFTYSAAEHANARAESPERRDLFRWWWRPLNIAIAATLVVLPAARRGDFSAKSILATLVVTIAALPFFAGLIFMPEFVKRLDRARFRRASAAREDPLETRTFGPDGFSSGDWPRAIPWPMITRVVESEQFFFVCYATSHVPEYVPKRAMSESESNSLRSLLANELRSRPA